MDKIDIVRKAFSFTTSAEEANSYLADDFEASDSVGGPVMNKQAWLGMGTLFRSSMPDAGFIIDEIHQEGEDVICTGHFTGTFLHDFDLSAMNMGMIKATGKAVTFPPGTSRISFRGDKISKNKDLDTGPNAGFAAFLNALRNENG
jgi:SnoaL-like domain